MRGDGEQRRYGIASHERLPNAIARDIGIAIVTGVHRPGDALEGEVAAADTLRVSRSAYREAIRILAAKGLVETQPKTGTKVCAREDWNLLDPDVLHWFLSSKPTLAFLQELFELRLMIEPHAAALAAERSTARDLSVIAGALETMRRHEHDSVEGQAADEQFHASIFAATHNGMVTRLASVIAAAVGYVAEFKRERHLPRDPLPDHQALYDAIAARKPDNARKIMTRLIEHAREDMRA